MVDAVKKDQNLTVNRSRRAVSIQKFISEGDVHRDFLLQIFIPAIVGVPALGEVVLAVLTECAGTGQCCIVLFCFHSVSFPVPGQDGGHRKSRGNNVPPAKTSPKRYDKTRWYIGSQTQPYKKLLSMTPSASTVPMAILERYDLIEVFLPPKGRMNRLIVQIRCSVHPLWHYLRLALGLVCASALPATDFALEP